MKKKSVLLAAILTSFAALPSLSQAKNSGRILIVVTNENSLPDGTPSGIHFNELTHPYRAFVHAGFDVDLASPLGGNAPVDPATLGLEDPINAEFWANEKRRNQLANTLAVGSVEVEDYDAIYLAGGVSTMWDFPYSEELHNTVASFYERNKVVGAVCHGPAGLVNVRLSNGQPLVAGKKISSFTDEEETARSREKVVPFLLETKLRSLGAEFKESANFKYRVVTDGNLITGQNPASAFGVAHEILARISELNAK